MIGGGTAAKRGRTSTGTATGGGTHRARGPVGRTAARAGRWANAKTGGRAGRAWHAARTATNPRQARTNAAAAMRAGRRGYARWDAQMTGGLMTLMVLIRRWWTGETTKTTDPQQTDTTVPDDQNHDHQGQDRRRRRPRQEHDPNERTRPMSNNGFPLVVIAAEMNAAAAAHAPVDMWQVAGELDQMRDLPTNVALALRTYTQRLAGEYPINPVVLEKIFELYTATAALVAIAEEIGPLFRGVHAEDLKREENPRVNEPLWNV